MSAGEGFRTDIIPPAFFDDGHDGTWLEAILFSPLLNVRDYAGDRLADRDGLAPVAPFHTQNTSEEEVPNHGEQ